MHVKSNSQVESTDEKLKQEKKGNFKDENEEKTALKNFSTFHSKCILSLQGKIFSQKIYFNNLNKVFVLIFFLLIIVLYLSI